MIILSEQRKEKEEQNLSNEKKDEDCVSAPMTWETMAALISVITVGIAVGRVIANLSKTLTKLNCSVDSLNSALQSFIDRSEKEHGQLNREIAHLKKDVIRHGVRLSHLESYDKERND